MQRFLHEQYIEQEAHIVGQRNIVHPYYQVATTHLKCLTTLVAP